MSRDDGAPKAHTHALAPEDVLRAKVKAELRKRLRGVRKTAPLDALGERSAKIIARLEEHPAVIAAKSIALFFPIVARHEVDLRAFDGWLRTRGVRVAYPGIDPDTNVMTFRFAETTALEERGFGFAEPPPDAEEPSALDVVIVPAIAIDPTGQRIGYGAGYYDRTLPRYCPPGVSIAVAYDWQVVAEVPAQPFDVPVRWVATDERLFDCAT